MSQFDEIVKNIALENEKYGYNPEIGTNWGKLSWNIRDKCIKLMDAKTKVRLSETNSFYKEHAKEYNLKPYYIVETIALESKKCNYNPEKDMNWDILPVEMRLECVKWMDFKTRTRLSATSKTEKSLVEAKKYRIDQAKLFMINYTLRRWMLEPCSESFRSSDPGLTDAFVSAMFKNCEIKTFWMNRVRQWYDQRARNRKIAKFAPFHFKRVSVFCERDLYFFMENCVNLEKIDFYGHFTPDPNILELPSVLDVKEFRISDLDCSGEFEEFFIGLVQKWIDNDVEIGKSIQFNVSTPGMVGSFVDEFADRVVEETDEEVRIRMNNDKTHILLRIIGFNDNMPHFPPSLGIEYFSCKVIPFDMPKSEYGKGDEWIQAVYEKELKADGVLEKAMEFDAEDQAVWGLEYS